MGVVRDGILLPLWVVALSIALPAPSAQALDRDSRTVLKAGTYGILAGTAVGLLTWPVSQTNRSVFIGSSMGLYLGLAVGIYHITHRDDPSNPLRESADARGETDELSSSILSEGPAAGVTGPGPAILELRWDVARF